MYKVTVKFTDLQDDGFTYYPGDTFPREGFSADTKRIAELSTSANRRGIPLIKEEKATELEPTDEYTSEKSIFEMDEINNEPKKRGKKHKENIDTETE